MASAITDLIDRVSDSSTGRPIIATLAAPGKAIAAGSINLAAATNWTTSSAIHFSIYATTTIGSTTVKDATTQTDWKGTLSGTTISNLTLTGGTDRAYTAGAIVELTPTARYAKDLYDWAMNQHNQNGTHGVVTATSVATTGLLSSAGGLTVSSGGVSLPNNAIDANEIATSAITLGYAEVTTTFSTTSATVVQVTGLSTTVTIPAGGRRVKVSVFTADLSINSNNVTAELSLWDGTVGSGTQLSAWAQVNNTNPAALHAGAYVVSVKTPAAGSKTYNVGLKTTAGTASVVAAASNPAFILVEAI